MSTETNCWCYTEFGDASEILKFGRLTLPPPGQHQVLVKVKAAGLNPVDSLLFKGKLEAERIAFPAIPCWDFSGVVEAVGTAVSKFKAGDEVYGGNQSYLYGSLAEHVLCNEDKMALKPSSLSFVEAAALPVALLTGLEALDRSGLKQGGKVLITAGAGGVGVHAIQLAKHVFKARTIAVTASVKKHTFLASLGANLLLDYHEHKFEDILKDFDAVLDSSQEAEKALTIIKPSGKVVTITSFDAKPPVEIMHLDIKGAGLERLAPFLERRVVKPILDHAKPWPFSQVKEAYAHLNSHTVTGKVVVVVEEEPTIEGNGATVVA